MPPHKISIVPNTYPFFSMFCQQTQSTKALGQISQFSFCKIFHVYFANLDHSNKVQFWPVVAPKWPLILARLKFVFYLFSTMKELLFYFLQKKINQSSTISPSCATNKFWLTSLPSMGKLLTPIEPSWKATFSFNSPHCK